MSLASVNLLVAGFGTVLAVGAVLFVVIFLVNVIIEIVAMFFNDE